MRKQIEQFVFDISNSAYFSTYVLVADLVLDHHPFTLNPQEP